MTALLTAAAVWAFLYITVVWPICAMAKQADIDAAMRRHPSSYFKAGNYVQSTRTTPGKFDLSKARVLPPGVGWAPTFSDDTEAAIEAAVGIVDDGKALIRETEAFLKWSADA